MSQPVHAMSKRKLKCLSGSDKLRIVRRFEEGISREQLCREFDVPRSTLCRILNNKDKIESQCNEGHGDSVRARQSKCPELEKCLLEWIRHCEEDDVPVNGPIIKDQALRFAAMLGISDFKASNGWLEGFKNRISLTEIFTMEFPLEDDCKPAHSMDPLRISSSGLTPEDEGYRLEQNPIASEGIPAENDAGKSAGSDSDPSVLAYLKSALSSTTPVLKVHHFRRKWLTLEEKVHLLEEFETHQLSTRKLAEKFGVGKTQVSNLLKDKDAILRDWRENGMGGSMKKRMRKGSADVDAFVYEWFRNAQAQNIPVTGPLIQEKALEVAKALGNPEFKASNGWLCKFKARHGINWRTSTGEISDPMAFDGASVDYSGLSAELGRASASLATSEGFGETESDQAEVPIHPAVDWRSVLRNWCAGYSDCDVYNCLETSLLFGALPSQAMFTPGEKTAKQRLTVLLCANVAGDFEEPLIIGSTLPTQLENLRLRDLGFSWKVNQYSWMTPEIMTEWLDSFNLKMIVQKKNVVLILEDRKCHPHVDLSNVKLVFLPPNARQPLALGMVRSFKRRYRTHLLRHIICNKEPTVSKLDAALWITSAIGDIKAPEVHKCFCEVGLSGIKPEQITPGSSSELETLVQTFSMDLSAEDFVTSDNSLPTSYSETDIQAIVETIKTCQDDEPPKKELEFPKSDSHTVPTDPRTALENLQQVERFLLQDKNTSLFQKLHNIRLEMEKTYTAKCLAQNRNQDSFSIRNFKITYFDNECYYKLTNEPT